MGYVDLKIDVARNLRMLSLKEKKSAKAEDGGESSTSAAAAAASASANRNSNDQKPVCSSFLSSNLSCNDNAYVEDGNRMDLELYLAATRSDVDTFIDVLERVSMDKKLPLTVMLRQVSPAGNTLLYLSVIHSKVENAELIAYHFPQLIAKPNSQGDTALHLAARASCMATVFTLVGIRDAVLDGEIIDIDCLDDDLSASNPSSTGNGKRVKNWCHSLLSLRNHKGNVPLHEALIYRNSTLAFKLFDSDPPVSYYLNDEGESPLYLAAKVGCLRMVKRMLEHQRCEWSKDDRPLEGKSAVHIAVSKRNRGMLELLLDMEPRFIRLRDEEGRTPLHLAASLGYPEGVQFLLNVDDGGVFMRDNNGLLPVHLASIKGHINIVLLLLNVWPDTCELLSSNGQNILHVAAKSGECIMVSYILESPEFEALVNMKDEDGNTPLHLATMNWHPKIVSFLTWDHRVDLKSVNKEGRTALDCAIYCMETMPSFRMVYKTYKKNKSGKNVHCLIFKTASMLSNLSSFCLELNFFTTMVLTWKPKLF